MTVIRSVHAFSRGSDKKTHHSLIVESINMMTYGIGVSMDRVDIGSDNTENSVLRHTFGTIDFWM